MIYKQVLFMWCILRRGGHGLGLIGIHTYIRTYIHIMCRFIAFWLQHLCGVQSTNMDRLAASRAPESLIDQVAMPITWYYRH